MAASTHGVKRKIITALERHRELRPSEIAQGLGGEWLNSQVKLRQLLGRMLRAHLLCKVRHGVYSLSPNYQLRGLGVNERVETRAFEFLKRRGGIVRTKELHDTIGDRPVGGAERGYGHKLITRVLKSSPRIHKDFGRGIWNLDEIERAKLPLIGEWAEYQIEDSWSADVDGARFDDWKAKRDDFFDAVGTAFMEARSGRSIIDVASDTDIQEALRLMASAAPSARGEALDGLRGDVEEELRAGGVTDPWLIAQKVRERKPLDLGVHLYAMFELGNVALHRSAPIEFYTACAAVFGVCAARLTRGEVRALDDVNDDDEFQPGQFGDDDVESIPQSAFGVK